MTLAEKEEQEMFVMSLRLETTKKLADAEEAIRYIQLCAPVMTYSEAWTLYCMGIIDFERYKQVRDYYGRNK